MFDYSVVRAEGGMLEVGVGSRGNVEFISALAPEVARTEAGLGVGSTRWELEQSLGAEMQYSDRVSDPQVVRYEKYPQARFVLSGEQVIAMVVSQEPNSPTKRGKKRDCPVSILEKNPEVAKRVAKMPLGNIKYGCIGRVQAALITHNKKANLVVASGGKLKRVPVLQPKGALFTALLDSTGDGEHEIATVYADANPNALAVRLRLERLTGSKPTTLVDQRVYRIERDAAVWVGAESLTEVELLLELARKNRSLSVSGLYLQRSKKDVRNLVPLTPVDINTAAIRSAEERRDKSGESSKNRGASKPSAAPKSKKGNSNALPKGTLEKKQETAEQ